MNLKIKCKGCDRVHDVAFADEGHDDEEYGWKPDKGQFQRFASFECRGLDPVRSYRIIEQEFNPLRENTKKLSSQNLPFCATEQSAFSYCARSCT